ncbi:MAG: FAD-dependent oxidoreductase [Actinobacteria bacterium]|nr:FAD-dependent oxidoreductase [Actinomycetota bacterium]MBU1943956.1 FAD-dependent oxidoreductase [Actinomycetota bacterium]MBU2686956.1 FAD-dependent oxidoreductase [Actinomycetota bacterium]
MKALVMGGGMAGLATAINLLDLGVEVELIEADDMFGGRASSWLDSDGDMIDNALHVFFPYYVNLINFFRKMGIHENIIWKDPEFYYMQPGGREAVLRFANLPAPLHAAAAYASLVKAYKGLPKWKMLCTAAAMGMGVSRYSTKQLDELDDITFGMWAMRMAPKGAFKPMEPGINGLTFTPSYMISAKVMLNWFKKVSASAETSRVGFANGGLGEIWVDNCLDYIRSKGGAFELGKSVTAVNIENGKVKGVTVNGSEERTADLYVSAISPYALRRVLPDECFKLEYFRDLWHFQYAPSMSLQVWFDRKLTDVDVTFFSTDCIFNTYADLSNVLPDIFKGGSMLEMVLSPADHIQGLPDDVIFDIAIEQIREHFPLARDAEVRKWKVVRERQGVYRALPGMERHRPYQRSPYDNLYLSGDYTKTHVSSGGMEAAIWTANHCAELIAADKLDREMSLNEEFRYDRGLMPFIKPAMRFGPPLAALALAATLVRKLIKRG